MKKSYDAMAKSIIFANTRDTFKSDEEYISIVLENVSDFFENIFNDIEELFFNAPDDINDEIYSSKE